MMKFSGGKEVWHHPNVYICLWVAEGGERRRKHSVYSGVDTLKSQSLEAVYSSTVYDICRLTI